MRHLKVLMVSSIVAVLSFGALSYAGVLPNPVAAGKAAVTAHEKGELEKDREQGGGDDRQAAKEAQDHERSGADE